MLNSEFFFEPVLAPNLNLRSFMFPQFRRLSARGAVRLKKEWVFTEVSSLFLQLLRSSARGAVRSRNVHRFFCFSKWAVGALLTKGMSCCRLGGSQGARAAGTRIPSAVWWVSSRAQITRVTAHMVAFSMWQYSTWTQAYTFKLECKVYFRSFCNQSCLDNVTMF